MGQIASQLTEEALDFDAKLASILTIASSFLWAGEIERREAMEGYKGQAMVRLRKQQALKGREGVSVSCAWYGSSWVRDGEKERKTVGRVLFSMIPKACQRSFNSCRPHGLHLKNCLFLSDEYGSSLIERVKASQRSFKNSPPTHYTCRFASCIFVGPIFSLQNFDLGKMKSPPVSLSTFCIDRLMPLQVHI